MFHPGLHTSASSNGTSPRVQGDTAPDVPRGTASVEDTETRQQSPVNSHSLSDSDGFNSPHVQSDTASSTEEITRQRNANSQPSGSSGLYDSDGTSRHITEENTRQRNASSLPSSSSGLYDSGGTSRHVTEENTRQRNAEAHPSSSSGLYESDGNSRHVEENMPQYVEGYSPRSMYISTRDFGLYRIKKYEGSGVFARPPPAHLQKEIDRLRQSFQRLDSMIQGDRSHPQLVALDSIDCTFEGWKVAKRTAETCHYGCFMSDDEFWKEHVLPLRSKQSEHEKKTAQKLVERTERKKLMEQKKCEQSDDAVLCAVCLEHERTHAFVPCGHMVVCEECAHTLEESKTNRACPVCRKGFQQTMEVFL